MFKSYKPLATILSIVIMLSMLLAGCAPAATPAPAEEPAASEAPAVAEAPATEAPAAEEPAAPSGEKVKITFWHHTYTVATDWIKEKAAAYQKDNPNVEIEVVEYPHGDYEVKLRAAIAAGNPPDIINMLDYLFPEFYSKGWLAPVNPADFGAADEAGVNALYEEPALPGMTFDGKIYGIPAEYNTFVLFLNKQMFQEAGLDAEALVKQSKEKPMTWDEFFELAKKLTKTDANGNVTQMGFNWVWGLDSFWYAQQFWSGAQQYGCKVLDDSGKAAINSPECVAMFTDTWYRLSADKLSGPDMATKNAVYAFQDFMDKRQAMVIGGPWAPAAWRENSPEVYDNFVVAPMPQKDAANQQTFVHTYAYAVSAGSKVADEAWKFLNYLEQDPAEMYTVAGYINGRKGVFESPDVQKELRDAEVYKQSYATGTFVWRSETWAQEGDIIKKAIEQFMQDGNVQGALDSAAAEINKVRGQ